MSYTIDEEAVLSLRLESKKFQADLKDVNSRLKKNFSEFEAKNAIGLEDKLSKLKTRVSDMVNPTAKLQQRMKSLSGSMLGLGLNMMFVGMQIQRTTTQIGLATTKTFLDIAHGQTDAAKSLIGLQASWEFFKYSIGEAISNGLKPLMPYLLGMLDWASKFVAAHPEATFAALAVAFGVGTAMSLGGNMLTFASSLVNLASNWEGTIKPALNGIGDKLGTIATKATELTAGAFLISFGIKDLTEGISNDDFKKAVTGAMETLSGGFLVMGKTKLGVAAFIATIAFKLAVDDTFYNSFIELISKVSRFAFAMFVGVGQAIIGMMTKPLSDLSEGLSALSQGKYLTAFNKLSASTTGFSAMSGAGSGFMEGFKNGFQGFDLQGSQNAIHALTDPIRNLLSTGDPNGTSPSVTTNTNSNNQKSIVFNNYGTVNTGGSSNSILNPYGNLASMVSN
jgi:hypothetical protein